MLLLSSIMTEIRYWPRIGMRVERKAAEQFIDKLVLVINHVLTACSPSQDIENLKIRPLTPEKMGIAAANLCDREWDNIQYTEKLPDWLKGRSVVLTRSFTIVIKCTNFILFLAWFQFSI